MIALVAAVSAGGIAGTLLRFAAGNWVNAHWPRHFYLGTLAVNLIGCLLIGLLYGLFLHRPLVPVELRAGLIVGFLGGLTTFSSFSMDTVRLLESGQAPLAFGYASLSVVGGLLATWAGLSLTKF
ncbi:MULTISPECIES: fluoride efflux transporter CrcB [Pseudomonas]|jgi:CrcB protein|uniref:Fluoride-specific ion channel FluC n=2 Tax=Pseudomonas TaxID=286 RepID=A0A9X8ENZ7_PSEPU|nr:MULTISPECIES: fluoride efflux transporter CrcB [Pseudomonas]KIU53024.1 camphor resistance protein CrcB [Pseudomonas putida]KTC22501.1 camphor resistance protein CrcB [Pseudomonas putida]MBG8562463.1 fluoride efflux transporter CrcB [Pseudomonas qingdaonensis]MCO7506024.1 fluoride efflux transporter CrcB [Pseudomonas sp. VE 267-6A]MCO7530030.1 fluoride efflux transporter CrcB [Pseudomonas sp. 2]